MSQTEAERTAINKLAGATDTIRRLHEENGRFRAINAELLAAAKAVAARIAIHKDEPEPIVALRAAIANAEKMT
jgi:hypothetical protein